MFESAETLVSDYDDAQLATMLALAKQRSTTFRRRQRRRRSMTGARAPARHSPRNRLRHPPRRDDASRHTSATNLSPP